MKFWSIGGIDDLSCTLFMMAVLEISLLRLCGSPRAILPIALYVRDPIIG